MPTKAATPLERAAFFGTLLLLLSKSPSAQTSVALAAQPNLNSKLQQVRYALRLQGGELRGNAAPVLAEAISSAQFVLIGEPHVSREIPQFTTAVCNVMAPKGLSAMAVEVGPQVAKFVSATLGKPNRIDQMRALTSRYPDSVAFLNIQQENELVNYCSQVAHNPNFQVWGLDQEFLGSAGWLLDQVLATHPGSRATVLLRRLKSEEQRDVALAKETGNPAKLFLISASDSELSEVVTILKVEGNAIANVLIGELVESHQIYVKNLAGSPDANRQRALLLKRNLRKHIDVSSQPAKPQRVLMKLGDLHLYKGVNPLHQRDLGNYVAELADGQKTSSLHIMIVGAKGVHPTYGGYGRPSKLEPFVEGEEEDNRWLKPFIDQRVSDAWTLYDLRRLQFQNLGTISPDMERLVYGYDFLIIVPELTPADKI